MFTFFLTVLCVKTHENTISQQPYEKNKRKQRYQSAMGDLRIENVLIQVRGKLNEDSIKLWLSPYYEEGIGSNDSELEVRLSISS